MSHLSSIHDLYQGLLRSIGEISLPDCPERQAVHIQNFFCTYDPAHAEREREEMREERGEMRVTPLEAACGFVDGWRQNKKR